MGRPRWMPPGAVGAPGRGAPADAAGDGRGGGAVYTGRGPVCGMITRRGAGCIVAASGEDAATVLSISDPASAPPPDTASGVTAEPGASSGEAALADCTSPAAAGTWLDGTATGAAAAGEAAAGCAGRAMTPIGRPVVGCTCTRGAAAATTGGRATTGPVGALAAIAGACCGGAATIFGPWRGCGTTRRGAGCAGISGIRELDGAAAGCAGAGAAGAAAAGDVEAARGAAAGRTLAGASAVCAAGLPVWGDSVAGAAMGGAAAAGRGAGLRCSRSASSLRCWIARITSPGLDTCDQSMRGAEPSCLLDALPPLRLPPRRKYPRTRSASSASRELECVLTPPTPTSLSESRMALLFTSSSRARSLIRTLLIRPF